MSNSATAVETYQKIERRLIPFLFACSVLAYLDRINIGFAKLQFTRDLGIGDAAYGFGAGVFYAGYILCEIPSNLLLQRIGARRVFVRILISWGLVSAAMSLVTKPAHLYVLRTILGAAEAGAFPGIILYLTYWISAARRARANSLFLMALPTAGMIGGPVSGWLMSHAAGVLGLRGWQWLFLIEGLPSVILGIAAYFYLDDRPHDARWLTDSEKQIVERDVGKDRRTKAARTGALRALLAEPSTYACAAAYFGVICGANANAFWTPSAIRMLGVTDVGTVGMLSAIPYLAALPAMYWIGRHSDATLERRWHVALCLGVAATSFVLLGPLARFPLVAIVLLTIAAASTFGAMTVFWTIPPAYLPSDAAAGGIALVSSCGALGGFVSPTLVGWFAAETGSPYSGMAVVGGLMAVGGIALLLGLPRTIIRDPIPHAAAAR